MNTCREGRFDQAAAQIMYDTIAGVTTRPHLTSETTFLPSHHQPDHMLVRFGVTSCDTYTGPRARGFRPSIDLARLNPTANEFMPHTYTRLPSTALHPAGVVGLNPTANEFAPTEMPHFWHQFTPDRHYCPNFGTRRDPGTITAGETGLQTVFAGHGPNPHFGASTPSNRSRNLRAREETVDVYNGGTFIRTVPLKTLVRFSGTAARTFMEPPRMTTTRVEGKSVATSETNSDSPGARSISTAEGTAHGPSTEPTERSTPSPSFKQFRNPGTRRKQLILKMAGAENPTDQVVAWATKWMLDNEHAKDRLIQYAPDVTNLSFLDLVDFYQASILLELRPEPKHVSWTIYKRLTDNRPTLSMFRALNSYIPFEDRVIDRAINSYIEHWAEYSHEEFRDMWLFLSYEGSRKIKDRLDFVTRIRSLKQKTQEREARQKNSDGKQQDGASRRRNRRAQQKKTGQGDERKA